jgi:tripartite-type tricarboxylate transporter receptor subunit TctC
VEIECLIVEGEMGRNTASLRRTGMAILLIGAALVFLKPASADEFYKGKTLNVIIGYSVGGGYDLYARVLARHLGKHIPGNPTVVPQNMVGAGSLRAANYIYRVAPKDGTVIGTFSRSGAVAPLISSAKFDTRKFAWLGSITKDVSVCITWHSSPIKTWNDLKSHQFVAGGEGAGSDPDIFALLYKNVFGANIKLVSGYPGTNDISLAMERGEVDGMCGISWSTIKSRHADWIAGHKINVVVQAALDKDMDLPNVPLASELASTPDQKKILQLFLAPQALARPFAAPPGIPEDRKLLLQKAFDETMKGPDFLAEAKKLRLDVNPLPGSKIEALVKELYTYPKAIADKAAKAVQ